MTEKFTVTIKYNQCESKLSFRKGESLLSLCQKKGIGVTAFCGGRGTCGACKVRYLTRAPIPDVWERKRILPEELRQGVRLLCRTHPIGDCAIEILKGEQPAIQEALFKLDAPPLQDTICIDIGTTTILMEYRSAADGQVKDRRMFVNPQCSFGADVISRLDASLQGMKKELRDGIRNTIAININNIMVTNETAKPRVYIGANTAMRYLFAGLDAEEIAKAPFLATHLAEEEYEIETSETILPVTFLPGFSAFVGGDIYADLLALTHTCALNNGWHLLTDLGTNAETVLFYKDGEHIRGYAASCAAGSAFDRPVGTGLWGAELILLAAKLLKTGVLDPTGAFTVRDEIQSELAKENGFSDKHTLQQALRQLQLAKAAVRAGIEILLKRAALAYENLETVFIAGGFGTFLDISAAGDIGLLPAKDTKVISCGNLCILGTAVYAAGHRLNAFLTTIDLAAEADFETTYVNCLNYPAI